MGEPAPPAPNAQLARYIGLATTQAGAVRPIHVTEDGFAGSDFP